MHHKINGMFVQVAKLQLLKQSVSRFEDFVQTAFPDSGFVITNIEQMVSSLAARVASLEANATSCTVLGGRVDEAASSARGRASESHRTRHRHPDMRWDASPTP